MTLVDFNREDLLYIAINMREEDRKEIFATKWHDDPIALVDECCSLPALYNNAVIVKKERPIAIIGAMPCWPGVWSAWLFGTDEFDKISLSLTKWVKKVFIPTLQTKAHRAECRAICSNTAAIRWLETCGGTREATLKGFGKNKEDFYVYAWQHNQ